MVTSLSRFALLEGPIRHNKFISIFKWDISIAWKFLFGKKLFASKIILEFLGPNIMSLAMRDRLGQMLAPFDLTNFAFPELYGLLVQEPN